MPPVTQALLITNVAVFLLQGAGGEALVEWFALWPIGSSGPGFEIWQLVTYSFLHGGLAHIGFNMFALYMFGGDIERLLGSRFFLAYYFACVVSAALFQLVISSLVGGPAYPVIGASGGIYGVLLAFGIYFPRRMVMLIIPPIPMQARTFVVLVGALELIFGVTGTGAGVAHFAHLGGMLGGWLMIRYRRRGLPFSGPR
ncbi:MAG: rhomboid family intramembrane serine protease [Burkholderiales bacterium]